MTAKKDLKKRVRERQAKTGERYTAARKHVLGQAPRERAAGVEVSPEELTPLAAGLRCRAFVTPGFPEPLRRPALEQLRKLVAETTDEPGTSLFRRALLGEEGAGSIDGALSPLRHVFAVQGFVRNLRLGIRGPSRDGLFLAFDVAEAGQPPFAVVASLYPSLEGFAPSGKLKLKGWRLLLAPADDWLGAQKGLAGVAFVPPELPLHPSTE